MLVAVFIGVLFTHVTCDASDFVNNTEVDKYLGPE
jgi:hypothetical protein